MGKKLVVAVAIFLSSTPLFSQDTANNAGQVSKKYLDVVCTSSSGLSKKLDKKANKALRLFKKQEAKLMVKLSKTDSAAAQAVFAGTDQKYKELEQKLKGGELKQYIPQVDSLATSLKFLEANPQFLKEAEAVRGKLKEAMGKMEALKSQLKKAEDIKQFLKERKQFLKEQLGRFGLARELKKINKQVYYYSAQVNEYKAALKDPKKAGKKALELLAKNKSFREFMRKNSQLASLFRMPGDPNDAASTPNLAGLQTRAQVNALIQQQIAAGGPTAQAQFQQNIQAAQSQLSQLKDKVMKLGGGNGDMEMPEGFKPNNQKTKSFFQRLELGANLQSQRSNGILPTTSDIALSIGYKLNDKSIIGVGASYKLGWGQNIQNIRFSHQGLGARSFIDWKLKGALWISGGFEMNYRPDLADVTVPSPFGGSRKGAAWQRSGLVGLSRKIPIKTKFFKNTRIQLLWDFLSYEQVPRGQALVMRIGYTF